MIPAFLVGVLLPVLAKILNMGDGWTGLVVLGVVAECGIVMLVSLGCVKVGAGVACLFYASACCYHLWIGHQRCGCMGDWFHGYLKGAELLYASIMGGALTSCSLRRD